MPENWYALCIAILREDTSVEQAFQLYSTGKKSNKLITNMDIEDMIKLREEYTLAEIGYMYGITENATLKRIERYKSKS